ncbi:hypothetical protein D3C72_2036620 [compost metagenome]
MPYSSVVSGCSTMRRPPRVLTYCIAAGLPVTAASARPISTRLNISWFFSTSTRCTCGYVSRRKLTDLVPTCTLTFLPFRSAGAWTVVLPLLTSATRPPV